MSTEVAEIFLNIKVQSPTKRGALVIKLVHRLGSPAAHANRRSCKSSAADFNVMNQSGTDLTQSTLRELGLTVGNLVDHLDSQPVRTQIADEVEKQFACTRSWRDNLVFRYVVTTAPQGGDQRLSILLGLGNSNLADQLCLT